MKYPNAYAHSTYDGKPMDQASIYAVHAAEEKLGYDLTILQGIGTAKASAGAHSKGRAVDFSPWDADNKLRVLKNVGFDIWHRPYEPGVWPEHLHGVLVLNTLNNAKGIDGVAFRQIGSFQNHRDGLISNLPDLSYHPSPPAIYLYPPKKEAVVPKVNNVTEARDAIVKAMHELGVAAAKLDNTDPKRVVAHSQIDDLHNLVVEAKKVLETLPKS